MIAERCFTKLLRCQATLALTVQSWSRSLYVTASMLDLICAFLNVLQAHPDIIAGSHDCDYFVFFV